MNNKLDQKKFDDIYFEGKPMEEHIDGQTFNVCYLREYMDPEHEGEFFMLTKRFIEMYLENSNTFLLIK